ncbi:RCC1 domain-containing protein [Stigmatella sp. ncwal1]|uniref:RCC1 domain-containing protein n=2 Tax=Stigmatella ashevillensis TaxID=2995309 RepID=A0ABT5DM45_9BACT|nr:RCC1 domain-containing protein [Stigmatella ashevillena]
MLRSALGGSQARSRIAAGGAHSLALRSNGTVWASGRNSYGQPGYGTSTNRTVPVQVQ